MAAKSSCTNAIMKKSSTYGMNCSWDLTSELSEQIQCDRRIVSNVIRLFDQDNTIPFIARYRQDQTNCMEPEKLREVKEKLEELREVQTKIVATVQKVEKLGRLNPSLKSSFLSSRTLEEVEHLYAPFKPTSKRTLADRARELGLEVFALQLLENPSAVNLQAAVNHQREGLASLMEVETGIQHIIADFISKDQRTLELIRQLGKTSRILLHSSQSKKNIKGKKDTAMKNKIKSPLKNRNNSDEEKFKLYYAFSCDVRRIQPHQVLAVNRGESHKVLTVKIEIPVSVRQAFLDFCRNTILPKNCNQHHYKMIMCSAEDAYKRLIEPLMTRTVRRDLNKVAEKASVSVFAANLKRLLLTPPVRGKSVIGVDPGFTHGCKFAVISSIGKIELTGVAYLHNKLGELYRKMEIEKITSAIKNYSCELVAIGNGVGCRETELFFSDQIKRGTFYPLRVVFSIVSEAGASIYSASEEATKEMPDLDVSVRGAVSIARRLQDPLAELVKIDPKNIGVGMYQHDIPEKQLKESLDGVVEESVSFVGVDVNVSSETLLRHIAGINSSLAKKIIDYRNKQGPFRSRTQLMAISGVGPKTFEQCAGFLRIMPETRDVCLNCEMETEEMDKEEKGRGKRLAKSQRGRTTKKMKTELDTEANNLDMTCIHPESYSIADRLIIMAGLDKKEIGTDGFISCLRKFLGSNDVNNLADQSKTTPTVMRHIINGLLQATGHDLRDDYEKPLFREGVRSISDLRCGAVVSGKVTNVTHFGAFVDIGVERNGLIPFRGNGGGKPTLELGNLVKVSVQSIDLKQNRIGLTLIGVTG